jgi:hypothetical protein
MLTKKLENGGFEISKSLIVPIINPAPTAMSAKRTV